MCQALRGRKGTLSGKFSDFRHALRVYLALMRLALIAVQVPGFQSFMIEAFAMNCCLYSVLDKSFDFRDANTVGVICFYISFPYSFCNIPLLVDVFYYYYDYIFIFFWEVLYPRIFISLPY